MPNGDLHINFQKAEVADTVRTVFHECAEGLISRRYVVCAHKSTSPELAVYIYPGSPETNKHTSTFVAFMSLCVQRQDIG